MPGFEKVGRVNDIAVGESKRIDLGGKQIAVFNVDGNYYAIDDECTHMGGSLSQAEVTGLQVACPWHGATFNLMNGKVAAGPTGKAVTCYKVRVTDGELEVAV